MTECAFTAPTAVSRSGLFAGKLFWVAQRVPLRSFRLTQIRDNGGTVVPLETKADHLIADHAREDCPVGSISWTFIEQSIKTGALEDPNDHVCGPPVGTHRSAGSTRPMNTVREAYTAEDDRLAYKWAKEAEKLGVSVKGNDLWKMLAEKNSRHPWQSWRSRWVKRLDGRPAPHGWENTPIDLPAAFDDFVTSWSDERKINTPGTSSPRASDGKRTRPPPAASPTPRTPIGKGKAPMRQEVTSPKHHGTPHSTSKKLESEAKRLSGSPRTPKSGAAQLRPPDTVRSTDAEVKTTPQASIQTPRAADLGENSIEVPFMTEDVFAIYCRIVEILNPDTLQDYKDNWRSWAAHIGKHTAQEWMNFFQAEIRPRHEEMNQSPMAADSVNPIILQRLKAYIELHPQQPYPGWTEIMKTQTTSMQTPKKRARDEDVRQEILPNGDESGSKRRRLEQTVRVWEDIVEEVRTKLPDRIERSAKSNIPDVIDLAAQSSDSSTSDSEDNEIDPVTVPRRLDNAREAQVAIFPYEDDTDGKEETSSLYYESDEHTVPVTHGTQTTQTILAEGTQSIDLTMLGPEDGFADSTDNESDSEDGDVQDLVNQQLQYEGTQEEGRAEEHEEEEEEDEDHKEDADEDVEQGTHLAIPEAEEALIDPSEYNNKHATSSVTVPQSQTTNSNSNETDDLNPQPFDEFAESLLKNGHTPQSIITAVHSTSANTSLIQIVLASLKQGKGIPANTRGIWTEADDANLMGQDARKLRAVESKHGYDGPEGVANRLEFLRDVGMEESQNE